MEQRIHQGGLIWPIMLVGAGIIFLLNNLGVVSWSVWSVIWRLWPVLLIAVGLDLVIGRRSLLGSLVVVVVVLALVGAAALYWTPQVANSAQQVRTERISQPLDGAASADVDIQVGTAQLNLHDAPESASLAEGTAALLGSERLMPRFWRTGDTAHYELRSEGDMTIAQMIPGSSERQWELALNPDLPMRLKVDAGVGTASLDLSHLKVDRLDANAGVGNTTVTLPQSGAVAVTVDGGVGQMHLIVPAGMAAHLHVDKGLGNFTLRGNFEKRGDEYFSAGYDKASDRADIRINGGVGRVVVEQIATG